MQMDHFTWVGKPQTALHKEKMREKKNPPKGRALHSLLISHQDLKNSKGGWV